MFLHHHPVDLCAVGRAQVDDAKSELVSAHFGVTARDLRVGEWDGAFGHAADDRRLVTECDAAAVGEYQRARRALSPTDDLGVDPEVALTGVLVEHERHLDEALEVVALVAAVLARGVGELSGQCVVEPGEALEVVARQPDREPVRRDRAAYAERAAGVHLAPDAATDLNGLEAAAAERFREGAFDQPLKPSLEPLQSHRSDATGATTSGNVHMDWYDHPPTRASRGTGRRAGFRFLCPQGCGGSSPPSRTLSRSGGSRDRRMPPAGTQRPSDG